MHCDVVKLGDQLRRQVGVVGDVPVHLLVRRRCHLHTHTHVESHALAVATTAGANRSKQAGPHELRGKHSRHQNTEVTHVLAVALREVDDARVDGGEAHEGAGAGVPQLRVEALLLCRHTHKHSPLV
jgi:hypothetical protein